MLKIVFLLIAALLAQKSAFAFDRISRFENMDLQNITDRIRPESSRAIPVVPACMIIKKFRATDKINKPEIITSVQTIIGYRERVELEYVTASSTFQLSEKIMNLLFSEGDGNSTLGSVIEANLDRKMVVVRAKIMDAQSSRLKESFVIITAPNQEFLILGRADCRE